MFAIGAHLVRTTYQRLDADTVPYERSLRLMWSALRLGYLTHAGNRKYAPGDLFCV